MKKLLMAFVPVVALSLISSVSVADGGGVLASTVGEVMLDAGKGFSAVKSGAEVKAGDRIVALKDSSAVISFGGRCSLSLSSNSLVTVASSDPCASEVVAVNRKSDANSVAAIGESDSDSKLAFLLAGGAAVGGVIIAASNSNDNDNKPLSP